MLVICIFPTHIREKVTHSAHSNKWLRSSILSEENFLKYLSLMVFMNKFMDIFT